MKSLIRFSLLAVACSVALDMASPLQANAGSAPAGTTTSGSSASGIEFSPSLGVANSSNPAAVSAILSQPAVVAAINNAISSISASLTPGSTPASPVPNQTVQPLSESAVAAVQAVLAATPNTIGTAATALSNEISAEMSAELGGTGVSAGTAARLADVAEAIATLSISPTSLPDAIKAINAAIDDASDAELEALAKSPSFLAARQAVTAVLSATR